MKGKVTLCMIVKGTDKSVAPQLAAALGSVSGYVDHIVVQLNAPKGRKIKDEIRAVANQYADEVYDYIWKNNFVDARNDCFAHTPKDSDWIMWLDADDTVFNPELIQPTLSKASPDINGVYILYDYNHDDHGNVITSHWVTRAVRNNGAFAWKSSVDDAETSVHETLIAVRNVTSYGEGSWKVIHHSDSKHREDSLMRNIDLLRSMYVRQANSGEIDPRIIYYLAIHLYDAYDFKQVKELLYQYLKLSGWNEERSMAHVYMGKIMKMEEHNEMAKTAFLLALGENPKNQNAYLELARLDAEMERYDQAVEFLRMATNIEQEITPMVKFNNDWQVYALMAECLCNVGGKYIDEAMEWINKALDIRPYDDMLKDAREKIQFLIDQRDDMKAAARLIRKLEKDEKDKIIPLINTLPKDLADAPPVVNARQHYTEPKKWPKKSMTIYVGNSSLGIWGPWSLNEGGIGGSEEAVIRLSRELSKMGWIVTVYGTPGERTGMHDGVMWAQYWEFNPKDEFDVLVVWRQPQMFEYKFNARKRYLWLHDVIPKAEFTKERIEHLDRVIFVSKYHADRPEYSDIPESKKFVSGNGIDPEQFAQLDGEHIKRDPFRCIYTSANERGLRILYDIWPDIKKAVPKATLDVYYGWQSFDAINRDNPERMMFKAVMQEKARELDGVTERGRVGQDELTRQTMGAGIFAYPCFFPEVNCISAQRAMAAGAVPVTSDYAVLKDIIQFGEAVPMHNFDAPDIERYKKRLLGWLQYPEKQNHIRKVMEAWARDYFDWKHTAQGWDEEML